MKNLAWLLLVVMLAVQFIGQYLWMTGVENQMGAMRSEIEVLKEAVIQLQDLVVAEDDSGLVVMIPVQPEKVGTLRPVTRR